MTLLLNLKYMLITFFFFRFSTNSAMHMHLEMKEWWLMTMNIFLVFTIKLNIVYQVDLE
jgi:hypothetical protein